MDGLTMKYFVLKPRGSDAYARASRDAMRAYAAAVQGENPALCDGLMLWARNEEEAAYRNDGQEKT